MRHGTLLDAAINGCYIRILFNILNDIMEREWTSMITAGIYFLCHLVILWRINSEAQVRERVENINIADMYLELFRMLFDVRGHMLPLMGLVAPFVRGIKGGFCNHTHSRTEGKIGKIAEIGACFDYCPDGFRRVARIREGIIAGDTHDIVAAVLLRCEIEPFQHIVHRADEDLYPHGFRQVYNYLILGAMTGGHYDTINSRGGLYPAEHVVKEGFAGKVHHGLPGQACRSHPCLNNGGYGCFHAVIIGPDDSRVEPYQALKVYHSSQDAQSGRGGYCFR